MKRFRSSPQNREARKAERAIAFERIVVSIEAGGLLNIPALSAAVGNRPTP
jgi:hypothetical protein